MRRNDRLALLIGGIVVVGAWLLLRVVPAAGRGWERVQERLASQRLLLTETREAVEALPQMEDSARGLTIRVATLAPKLLTGSSASLAASDLSGRLNTLVSLSHGRTTRFETTADSTTAGPLRRVTAVVGIETDFRGLTELLQKLSRDATVTVVERLQITASDPLPTDEAERLTVELRITAWYLGREGQS